MDFSEIKKFIIEGIMGKKMAVQGHTVGGQEGGGRSVGTYESNWLGMVCWTEGRWTDSIYNIYIS